MGFTDNTNNAGTAMNGSGGFILRQDNYNVNVNTTNAAGSALNNNKVIGLTTDTSGKSGIVAKSNSITRTSKSFKFCIKY